MKVSHNAMEKMINPIAEKKIMESEKIAEMANFERRKEEDKNNPETRLLLETDEKVRFAASRLLRDFKTVTKIPYEMLEHFSGQLSRGKEWEMEPHTLAAICEILEEEKK